MVHRILIFALALLLASSHPVAAYTISGTVTGGQTGLTLLKWVYAIPTTLDTFYTTIALPILNTYQLTNVEAGSYLILAYQDLNTNLLPDLDEPRGYWGGEYPEVLEVSSNMSGINIVLQNPNSGGFSGTVTYDGVNRGATLIAAFDNSAFTGQPHGLGVVLDTTGSGSYAAVVDTFGTYYAFAFMDLNLNFTYDDGEPRGVYGGATPLPIHVQPTNFPDNVDIVMTDPSAAREPLPEVARTLSLVSVYPNPFNSAAAIHFVTGAPSVVELALYDVLGREAMRREAGVLPAGDHRIVLSGDALPTGVYWLRLSAGADAVFAKVLLLK